MQKKYVILIITALALLVGLLIFFDLKGKGSIALTAPKDTPDNRKVIVEVLHENAEEAQTVELEPGETKSVRVDVGDVRIDSASGDLKAVDVVAVKSFSTTGVKVLDAEQRNIEQLGTSSRGCPVVAKTGAVYSYNCNGESPVMKHVNVNGSDNQYLFDGKIFSWLEVIDGNLMGFEKDKPDQLLYIDLSTEQIGVVPLSTQLQEYAKASMPTILVDQSSTTGAFALNFGATDLTYIFSSFTDTEPAKVTMPKEIDVKDKHRIVSYTYTQGRLIFFAGLGGSLDEGNVEDQANQGEPELDKNQKSYMYEYDPKGKLLDRITMPEQVTGQRMYKLPNNFYALEQLETMDIYHREGKDMKLIYKMEDVNAWAISGGKVYTNAKGTLYEFATKPDGSFSLHGRFSNKNLRVSEVTDSVKGVILSAFVGKGSGAPLNIYRVLNKGETANVPDQKEIVPARAVSFDGLEALLDYGMSSNQLDTVRTALSRYMSKSQPNVAKTTIKNVNVLGRDRGNPVATAEFDFYLQDSSTTLKGKAEYEGLLTVRLYLYDQAGNLLFDSQNE
jgi:hypothetical protein